MFSLLKLLPFECGHSRLEFFDPALPRFRIGQIPGDGVRLVIDGEPYLQQVVDRRLAQVRLRERDLRDRLQGHADVPRGHEPEEVQAVHGQHQRPVAAALPDAPGLQPEVIRGQVLHEYLVRAVESGDSGLEGALHEMEGEFGDSTHDQRAGNDTQHD